MSILVACLFLLLPAAFGVAGPPKETPLGPEHLLLLVNRNVPQSRELAEFYAKSRLVPDGRILSLDLPATTEIPAADYERTVVPQVRAFLRDNKLDQTVRCIVTFYGVPLRISPATLTDAERQEFTQVQRLAAESTAESSKRIADAESFLQSLNPKIATDPAADSPARVQSLLQQASQLAASKLDTASALAVLDGVCDRLEPVVGLPLRIQRATIEAGLDRKRLAAQAEAGATAGDLKREFDQAESDVQALSERRFDPEARQQLRDLAKRSLGLEAVSQVAMAQATYLDPADTVAAFDSELALVWWPWQQRKRWLVNPLNLYNAGNDPLPVPTLMTCRLDGPTVQIVRDGIILASLQAEKQGLKGRAVIDRGGAIRIDPDRAKPGYWEFEEDQLIRLTNLLARRTTLELLVDTQSSVLKPGSVLDGAVYTGWYSVRAYVPGVRFVPGGMGYHVASMEMVDLHSPDEKGWCAGMLRDGVAATLGAVAEPYLHAFPPPMEFFPLLLNGRYTLVETYWKTVPMASWMICLVGDPLYRPFAVSPALRDADLPDNIARALRGEKVIPAKPPEETQTPFPAGSANGDPPRDRADDVKGSTTSTTVPE